MWRATGSVVSVNPSTFLRTWAACILGCLPLLALLLVPQLMRSRAGSGELLILGTAMLLVLLVAAFVLAPAMSALFTAVPGRWEPRTAVRAAREVWRSRPGAAAVALLIAVAVYAAGQSLGYALGEALPYVSENPARLSDPDAPMWSIHYPAYLLQALVLYGFTTAAVAVYAWRVRALHLHQPRIDG